METLKTVVVADDHPVFLKGIARFFDEHAVFVSSIKTSDGQSCLEAILKFEPDWAVIDLAMPQRTGFDILEELLSRNCETRVIVLSMHTDVAYAARAKELGAAAFIAKEDALAELEAALSIGQNDFYTSQSVGQVAANFLLNTTVEKENELTRQEQRILALLSQGSTSKEIGAALDISTRTVQAHRRNMTEKLGLRGPNALMQYAVSQSGGGERKS